MQMHELHFQLTSLNTIYRNKLLTSSDTQDKSTYIFPFILNAIINYCPNKLPHTILYINFSLTINSLHNFIHVPEQNKNANPLNFKLNGRSDRHPLYICGSPSNRRAERKTQAFARLLRLRARVCYYYPGTSSSSHLWKLNGRDARACDARTSSRASESPTLLLFG